MGAGPRRMMGAGPTLAPERGSRLNRRARSRNAGATPMALEPEIAETGAWSGEAV
jgi:hypothetical protein